jgi:hypothetical protein
VYVTGYSLSGYSPPSTGYDIVTIAYTRAGVGLWTNRYDGGVKGPDQGGALAVDIGGGLFVAGHSSNGNDYDFVTIKYLLGGQTRLDLHRLNNHLVLSWTNAAFTLQSASVINGMFTNIPNATSPYTNPISGSQQFFRLISN